MTSPTVRIVAQGQILQGAPESPFLRLPDARSHFSERAARLESLASSSRTNADFLRLMARLARAQQTAIDAEPRPILPDSSRLELCQKHGLPPLGKDEARGLIWRSTLASILREVGPTAPEAVRQVLRHLESSSPEALETMADRLLGLDYPALNPAVVPFLASALQVHWVRCSTALGEGAFRKLDIPGICPVCGMLPVASALRIGIPVPGVRYLHCALCAADWQLARGQCTQCESREKIAYYHIEAESEAVKAEACEQCHSYLKIVNMEKDPLVDPVADDLASLALDVLMDEAGYERAGPNFLFVPGRP